MATAQTVPGIKAVAAAALIAEIGADMSQFPSAKHLTSWVGVCPDNKQSGGRRLFGQTTKGNVWGRAILGEVAWAAARTRSTYLSALFQRIARRRGKNKAIVAVAHSILVSLYYMLCDKRPYADLGADYFDHLDQARIERYHIKRLQQLGYTASLAPKEQPSLPRPSGFSLVVHLHNRGRSR